jgi:hypothetical protein
MTGRASDPDVSLRDELARIATALQSLSSGAEAGGYLRSQIGRLLKAQARAVQQEYARGVVHGQAEGRKSGFDRNRDKAAVRREVFQVLVVVGTGLALVVFSLVVGLR